MTSLDKIAKHQKLSLGLVFPIESYSGAIASMRDQEQLATRAEQLGFSALWFRDVPFHDPTFGDAGQLYDPWIYMTHIMHHTQHITLATGSIILPLRHPVHTAKSIQSLQQLSEGRLLMGIASGDRPIEYPAFDKDIASKASLFRDSYKYTRALLQDYPTHASLYYGHTNGTIDLLPKTKYSTPFLVTGHSGQTLPWIAENADGWLYYPRDFQFLQNNLANWSAALEVSNQPWKPYMQSLYLDLLQDDDTPPQGIHLGFKSGSEYALQHLKELERYGVNHVIINLKYGSRPAAEVIEQLGESILPHF